jgi:NTE family protein
MKRDIDKPLVGLALGSGAARGFTIIGVLKALKRHRIEADLIAGSSIGAIFGGAYAIERDIDKIEEVALSLQYDEVIGSFSDFAVRSGMSKGNKLLDVMKSYVGDRTIEGLALPFAAVATDSVTGDPIVVSQGSLAEAMRASSSIPGVFEPYAGSNGNLLDGGVCQQVPVRTARQMGADIVIAVNLSENRCVHKAGRVLTAMQQNLVLLCRNLARENCRDADIVISPRFESASQIDNFRNRAALIAEGERASEEQMDRIVAAVGPGADERIEQTGIDGRVERDRERTGR